MPSQENKAANSNAINLNTAALTAVDRQQEKVMEIRDTGKVDNPKSEELSNGIWDLTKVAFTSFGMMMAAGCSGKLEEAAMLQPPQPTGSNVLLDSNRYRWIGKTVTIQGKLEFAPELTKISVSATTSLKGLGSEFNPVSRTPPEVTYYLSYKLLGRDPEGNEVSLPVRTSYKERACNIDISLKDLGNRISKDTTAVSGIIRLDPVTDKPYLEYQSGIVGKR